MGEVIPAYSVRMLTDNGEDSVEVAVMLPGEM
jgi:hypothetical protein